MGSIIAVWIRDWHKTFTIRSSLWYICMIVVRSLHTYDCGILIFIFFCLPSLIFLSILISNKKRLRNQESVSFRAHTRSLKKKFKRISTRKSSLHVKWINLNPLMKKTKRQNQNQNVEGFAFLSAWPYGTTNHISFLLLIHMKVRWYRSLSKHCWRWIQGHIPLISWPSDHSIKCLMGIVLLIIISFHVWTDSCEDIGYEMRTSSCD